MSDRENPKIFISYSWDNGEMVELLCNRLFSDGIEVVLDKWDLKEGQDKYDFMERCVKDPEIGKVLIICGRSYYEKAESRSGGVGDETVIISGEIYGNTKQEKFIPVIAEKDENGKPYVPTYMRTRIYIDLSDPRSFESEYEKLVRNIYGMPQYIKPVLGKKPEWIDSEKLNLYGLRTDLFKLKQCSEKGQKGGIAKFQVDYVSELRKLVEVHTSPERVYEIFKSTKALRDIFLDYIEILADIAQDSGEIVAEYFEKLYNELTNLSVIKNYVDEGDKIVSDDLDFFKCLIWELFICTITYFRHIHDYLAINTILTYTYFLDNSYCGCPSENNYTAFRHYSRVVEEQYKPETEMKNYYTILGETICTQREYLPIYTSESMAESDLFLYQICPALYLLNSKYSHNPYWFPMLYVYAKGVPAEWNKMKSISYCKKMFALFGVNNLKELKDAVEKCKYDSTIKYYGAWEAAPSILSSIKVEEIGTLK